MKFTHVCVHTHVCTPTQMFELARDKSNEEEA